MPEITRKHTNARMSQLVIHNGIAYLAGQVGIPAASITDQTNDVLAKIDALLGSLPIRYIKWDMNRDLTQAVGADGRAGYLGFVQGLWGWWNPRTPPTNAYCKTMEPNWFCFFLDPPPPNRGGGIDLPL